MTEKQLRELLAQQNNTETEILEFKERKTKIPFSNGGTKEQNKKKCVYGYCVGIGNEGGGKLLIGIKDDGTIVGTNAKLKSDAKLWIHKKTGQKITIETVKINNGEVIVISIPTHPKGQILKFNGVPLMRVDDGLTEMSDEVQRTILLEVAPDRSEQIIEEATLNDLDSQAILKARKEFSIKHKKIDKLEIDGRSDEIFLNKAKLTKRGKITRTALLLLGKEESNYMLAPGTAKISWILKDRDGIEKDYEHFFAPLILNVDYIYDKIRKLRYRYIKGDSLFPDETDKYDAYVLREMIHNAIAHQDYILGGKINIVEYDDKVVIANQGSFLPGSVENVIKADAPSEIYRNKFLADAMTNLRMIDTIGSGIKKSFTIQKDKLFPLPDYDFSNERVQVTIYGTVLDMNYARKLTQVPNLGLLDIILLDKVQKDKSLTNKEIKYLKSKKLVEGRRPNYHISLNVAKQTDQKGEYIKQRGLKVVYYKMLILGYLDKYKVAGKQDIDKLILDILPSILDEKQKENKVRNIIYSMSKIDKSIINTGTTRYPKRKKV